MAFGFGFNKQKVLSAAEKFVQQGKLQNAIAEYEKIHKHDDKDLTVTNTIGDLYARLGESDKAIECFKSVGDAYAAQGFTVKGIAMYKKITKLQPSVDGSLKLAELYTQQGLFNDARAQYLQVAEDFMKSGDLEQAVRLFQKVLEMDPENVPMRVKLAEVYIKIGKKKEAWEIFSAAAESLRARGSLTAAEDILQRMLSLDPGNSYVLLMRGRAALESDDPKNAIQYLEKAADIDTHPEGLRDLLKAYLENGELAKCGPLAEKLLSVHNDPEGLFLLAEGAARLGHCHQALEIYTKHSDRLLATDSTKLLANLHALIAHIQDDAEALERLMELLKKSGESTHVNEVAELLAHASVKSGNLERARDLYQMLAASEPQNAMHAQNYQQVVERMEGSGSGRADVSAISPEEGALIVEELEATAPVIDQSYPDHIAVAVRSAVTDADLFLSYNLPDKAVVPLLGALPQAPQDVRLNQRLAALHTRFRRFREAAVCCRTLESAYHDAGHPDEAMRYGELAARYEQSAGTVSEDASAQAETTHAPGSNVGLHEAQAHAEFALNQTASVPVSEMQDVSAEWEDSLSIEDSTAAGEVKDGAGESNPEVAETLEEIRFYLEHFMTDQARTALEKLETLTKDASILNPLRMALESGATPSEESEPEVAEINADDPATFEIDTEAPVAEKISTSPDLMGYDHGAAEDHAIQAKPEELEPAHEQVTHFGVTQAEPAEAPQPVSMEAAHEEPSELTSLVADLEASLGDSFPTAPAIEDQPTAVPAVMRQSTAHQPVSNSAEALPKWPIPSSAKNVPVTSQPEAIAQASAPAASIETAPPIVSSATGAAAAPAMSYSPTPVRPLGAGAQAMHPSDSVDLSEMFGELKHELEEDVASADEDPETHYNLGVAFREMGLLDEAIAELQKVCSAIDRGQLFTQSVQTYTWLAQCFLDKGVPQAAIRWYEKALNIPGLDGEARVAINYELGSACETAHDKSGALRHFTYVYGANIDYRDVAERIQALKS
jgi:pilus assembly protein FimV